MKKKKNQSNSSQSSNLPDSKDISQNSTSSFSIFLTSSSSSIRQILPQRKGVYQTPISNTNQVQNQLLNPNNQNKKYSKNNINDIIYNDSLLRSPQTRSFLKDPFCIQNRKFLFEKPDFTIFQDDDLNMLLCHLREYSIDSAINRKYSEAKKSDALFDQIQYELMQRSIPSNKKKNEIEHSFEEQKKEEMAKLDNELYEFDEETKERRNQLLNKQIDDSNEFEKIWREEKPPKYRKPSSKLLHLLASEKRLARVGEYDEAQLYKAESAKLIEFERNQAQTLLNRDYKIAKAKFIKKQEEEFQNFTDSRQQQRDLILAKRMSIEETIQKREYIILDKIAQIPKTKNDESSPLVENQNFIGNAWLKYGTGGNIAKAKYDDHITFENPIPPLLPPNEEPELTKKDIKKKNENDDNITKQQENQIKKISQKKSNRLNSVSQNLRRNSSSRNSDLSSRANSNKEQQNRLSSNNSPRKPIKNRSIQNNSNLTSSSLSHSKSSLKNSNISHSNRRLSSVSKSSEKKPSFSSNSSVRKEVRHSNVDKSSHSKYSSMKSNKFDDMEQISSEKNKNKIDLNSSNSFESKKSDRKNDSNSKKSAIFNDNNNNNHTASDSSIVSAASEEFAESNSG